MLLVGWLGGMKMKPFKKNETGKARAVATCFTLIRDEKKLDKKQEKRRFFFSREMNIIIIQ